MYFVVDKNQCGMFYQKQSTRRGFLSSYEVHLHKPKRQEKVVLHEGGQPMLAGRVPSTERTRDQRLGSFGMRTVKIVKEK